MRKLTPAVACSRLVLIAFMALPTFAAEDYRDSFASRDPADAEACKQNLHLIFDAIQQYRNQHDNSFPDKLSELLPEFIQEPKILICPVVQRTSDTKSWRQNVRYVGASDLRTSYGYEFCPELVSSNVWRGVARTQREYKQRQMEALAAPVVPVVRCLAHTPILNLGYNGKIYTNLTLDWEHNFEHLKPANDLVPARLFADRATRKDVPIADFKPRDATVSVRLIDLTRHYNGLLNDDWQGFTGNNLASLPTGIQQFGEVPFDIRGVVQLRGRFLPSNFPKRVDGIEVKQAFRRLHILHATAFEVKTNSYLANYLIHYADGQTNQVPIVYGKQIADWWYDHDAVPDVTDARVVWTGNNEAASSYGKGIRLCRFTWENSRPDIAVEHISLVAAKSETGIFMVAITVEP